MIIFSKYLKHKKNLHEPELISHVKIYPHYKHTMGNEFSGLRFCPDDLEHQVKAELIISAIVVAARPL